MLAAGFVFAASCGDELVSGDDGDPSACVGGEYCVGDLVCVDGFCVPPGGSETGDDGGDGDGDSGDGDGECTPGSEGCDCELGETCDLGLSCVDGVCVSGSCGDGIVDPGEECDDGNEVDTDTCLSTCVAASCGDGFVGPGEGCDDGNDIDDDACTNDCKLASCGDAEVQDGEQCDDGNDDDTDACLSTCVGASCGDSQIWAGMEECDDGNAVDGDACLASCVEASCGDGVVWVDVEGCDDGNADNSDACVEGCMVASCGDGFVEAGVEECDDANADNTDTCLVDCVAASCGDGFVGPGEGCDDGNDNNNDACTNACALASCGDGFVEPGEDCDDGNANNTDACLDTCVDASCGDGFVWAFNENCDDGNANNADACLNTCEDAGCGDGFVWAGNEDCDDANANNADACLNTCEAAGCGDGFVWAGNEECDDGNLIDTDACVGPTCTVAVCGDGYVWAGNEECDDGNGEGHDGCEPGCEPTTITQIESGRHSNCVLFGDGAIRCWGDNFRGQLGLGNKLNIGDAPGEMPGPITDVGGPVVEIASANLTTCARLANNQVRCWGYGGAGTIGHEATNDIGDNPGEMPPPVIDVGAGTVIDLEGGDDYMCALFQDGKLRCWGRNTYGQLGQGHTNFVGANPGTMPPPDTDVGGSVAMIAVGMRHVCAVLYSGPVRCWGYFGGFGYGIMADIGDQPGDMPPGNVDVGPGVVTQIEAGSYSTCVVIDNGDLRCWGADNKGENGWGFSDTLGDEPGELPPPNTDYGAGVIEQLVRGWFTRVLLADGNVRTFGQSDWGNLGYPGLPDQGDDPGEMPTPNVDLGGGVVIQVSGQLYSQHSCALFDDFSVRCWGANQAGQLGIGSVETIGDDMGEMPPMPAQVY